MLFSWLSFIFYLTDLNRQIYNTHSHHSRITVFMFVYLYFGKILTAFVEAFERRTHTHTAGQAGRLAGGEGPTPKDKMKEPSMFKILKITTVNTNLVIFQKYKHHLMSSGYL